MLEDFVKHQHNPAQPIQLAERIEELRRIEQRGRIKSIISRLDRAVIMSRNELQLLPSILEGIPDEIQDFPESGRQKVAQQKTLCIDELKMLGKVADHLDELRLILFACLKE